VVVAVAGSDDSALKVDPVRGPPVVGVTTDSSGIGSITGLFFFRKLRERYQDAACSFVLASEGPFIFGNLMGGGNETLFDEGFGG
jgi:hypothetical protein